MWQRSHMIWLLWLGCDGDVGVADIGALEGQACEETAACAADLVCAQDGTCQEHGAPGTFLEGEGCLHAEECSIGLICDAEGICAEPGEAGTGLEDDTCESDSDCALGLVCDDGACVDLGVPYWGGLSCEPDGDEFALLFDVPSLPESGEIEFYRLPFASDVRADRDGLDLSGHPDPEDAGPHVDAWLAAAEAESGFGLNPVVTLRGSRPIDPASVIGGTTLKFASLDEQDDDYGLRGSFLYRTTPSRGRYACQNQVSVRTYPGVSLRPSTTYAVWLETTVVDADGETPSRSDDVKAALSDSPPSDARLLAAHGAAAPLRAYLTQSGPPAKDVGAFAVFTTSDPGRAARNLPGALSGGEVLSLGACSDDCGGCGDASGYDELHSRLSVATFQDADGAFQLQDGLPVPVGEESACVVFTQPHGDAPEGGWPIALIAQDEGASARDWVDSGLAGELAAEGIAAVSIELPHHGDRGRADDALHHLTEPTRWVGDRLQIAADLEQLAEALAPLEPGPLHVVGSGAGGELALAFAANRRDVATISVGGVGGSMTTRLLYGARDGVALSRDLQVLLADTRLGPYHPMLGILQSVLEPADALTYARAVWKDPATATSPSHVLHLYGLQDDETSLESQRALQTALGIPTTEGSLVDDFDQSVKAAPLSRNLLNEDGDRVTGASVQLEGGRDVIWTDAGRAHVVRFIASSIDAEAPTIE